MNDNELRDKLATESISSEMTGRLIPRWHIADFKAGWNAARANEPDYARLMRDTGGHVATIDKLINERDELSDEVKRLNTELGNADYERNIETSWLISAAEKLALALEQTLMILQDNFHRETCAKSRACHCGQIDWGNEALNEYRAKFTKGNNE